MVNVTGPGVKAANTHMVTTQSEEIQIDVQSMILSTLAHGGSVLVLGAGQMRFLAVALSGVIWLQVWALSGVIW